MEAIFLRTRKITLSRSHHHTWCNLKACILKGTTWLIQWLVWPHRYGSINEWLGIRKISWKRACERRFLHVPYIKNISHPLLWWSDAWWKVRAPWRFTRESTRWSCANRVTHPGPSLLPPLPPFSPLFSSKFPFDNVRAAILSVLVSLLLQAPDEAVSLDSV